MLVDKCVHRIFFVKGKYVIKTLLLEFSEKLHKESQGRKQGKNARKQRPKKENGTQTPGKGKNAKSNTEVIDQRSFYLLLCVSKSKCIV